MASASRAIILAAGTGSRLGAVDRPKPLTPVHGVSILHRALTGLAAAGVREAVVVVGHRAGDIVAATGDRFGGIRVSYVHSDAFAETNNAYSLWLARAELDRDVFLLDGDVLFDTELLRRLAASDAPATMAVAPWRAGMSGTVVRLVGDRVDRVHLGGDQDGLDLADLFKTVNIHLLRADYLATEFVPRLERLIGEGRRGAFHESVLAETVHHTGLSVRAVDCRDLRWQEVDDPTDLAAAEYTFGDSDQRLAQLQGQHGGYWRHQVTDHCLLYNPYFPPEELWRELSGALRPALTHYPVGQRTAGALLGAVIGQPAERLVVANGGCELISALGRLLDRVVLTVPGFNEYEAVTDPARTRHVLLAAPDFRLDVERTHRMALDSGAQAVIVTSPNNPTGLAVPQEELLRLAKLLAPTGIRLVVDESFVDFCEDDRSLEPHLGDFPTLVVLKSMSKVYGLAGLRLGYLACADPELVAAVTAQLPIWNINGLAEAFLRALPRYAGDFRSSLDRARADRDALHAGLAAIDGLTPLRSDANFVLARLEEPWTGPALVRSLFAEHGILVKDCAGKTMPEGERYVRIASREAADNQRLVEAVADVLTRDRP